MHSAHVDFAVTTPTEGQRPSLILRREERLGEACIATRGGAECLSITWSEAGARHNPVVVLWPIDRYSAGRVVFHVPNHIGEATLIFGGHEIPLDLRGMKGQWPLSKHKVAFPELKAGTTVYDVDGKSVTLAAINHDAKTGDLLLSFEAKNDSEASNFEPDIKFSGNRVTAAGRLFDGEVHFERDKPPSWRYTYLTHRVKKLGPGGSEVIEVRIPVRSGTDGRKFHFQ